MKLAITGGAGEGKSTVLSSVREAGVPAASVDDFAREVFESPVVQKGMARLFGKDEAPSREEVGRAVFRDPSLRRRLNALTHPLILARMRNEAAPVIEVPLLFEACLQGFFDRIWVVTCGPEEQLRRLTQRLGNEARAKQVIQSQLSTRAKCAFADRIIRTIQNPANVRQYVFDSLELDLPGSLARS